MSLHLRDGLKLSFLLSSFEVLFVLVLSLLVRSLLELFLYLYIAQRLNHSVSIFSCFLFAGKYRRYDFSSLRDLLRVVRNKHSHFRELPPDLQSRLGPIPDGFLAYFAARFPRLLTTCFYFALRWCKSEPIFVNYFPKGAEGLLSTSAPLEIRDPKIEAAAVEAAKLRLAAAAAEARQQRVTAESLGNGNTGGGGGGGGGGGMEGGTNAGSGTNINTPGASGGGIALPAESVAPPIAVHYDPATCTSILLFPRRIGSPNCDFYVKTGHCRFGETCRFDHPPEYSVRLNSQGLPIRPRQAMCQYYERNGDCKFGAACRFHHPQTPTAINTTSNTTTDNTNMPVMVPGAAAAASGAGVGLAIADLGGFDSTGAAAPGTPGVVVPGGGISSALSPNAAQFKSPWLAAASAGASVAGAVVPSPRKNIVGNSSGSGVNGGHGGNILNSNANAGGMTAPPGFRSSTDGS